MQQGSVVDLPSTTGVWQNYSALWSSGVSVSALLEIRMLTTAYEGNDFVLDDLSFRRVSVVAPPTLAIQRATAAAVVLSWPSVTNQLYQVQWAASLSTNQWFSLGAPVPGTGATASVTDAIVGYAQRFYRLLALD